jgi:hypothetical protein
MFPFSWFRKPEPQLPLVDDPEWKQDCLDWHGRELSGQHSHYCEDFDYMPIDETCKEFAACRCKLN